MAEPSDIAGQIYTRLLDASTPWKLDSPWGEVNLTIDARRALGRSDRTIVAIRR